MGVWECLVKLHGHIEEILHRWRNVFIFMVDEVIVAF